MLVQILHAYRHFPVLVSSQYSFIPSLTGNTVCLLTKTHKTHIREPSKNPPSPHTAPPPHRLLIRDSGLVGLHSQNHTQNMAKDHSPVKSFKRRLIYLQARWRKAEVASDNHWEKFDRPRCRCHYCHQWLERSPGAGQPLRLHPSPFLKELRMLHCSLPMGVLLPFNYRLHRTQRKLKDGILLFYSSG